MVGLWVFSAAVFADPDQSGLQPPLLSDAAALRLSAVRPQARPVWMLRGPVVVNEGPASVRPRARPRYLPDARWDHRPGAALWTRAAMSALSAHGAAMVDVVPRDIAAWCPAYPQNPPDRRRAFWVGMMSALARHESTWNPDAVGGGGKWYGLLQIYPDTARRYGCRARTGEALKDPADNLSCAARIMAVTVTRDQAVALRDSRWRGVAADWGPMTNRSKIAEMQTWTRAQDYCQPQAAVLTSLRPVARPKG
ncbi:lytic transglycosylase domain-containing protein [Loktanella sp. IMCC34160]|nr:lytic transglycosylase domain-containing protein [Loktanella sp. IMCC34160]